MWLYRYDNEKIIMSVEVCVWDERWGMHSVHSLLCLAHRPFWVLIMNSETAQEQRNWFTMTHQSSLTMHPRCGGGEKNLLNGRGFQPWHLHTNPLKTSNTLGFLVLSISNKGWWPPCAHTTVACHHSGVAEPIGLRTADIKLLCVLQRWASQ